MVCSLYLPQGFLCPFISLDCGYLLVIFLTAVTFLSFFLHQVLQRKTEEASAATKRLRDMIAARKVISNDSNRSTG